MFVNCHCSNFYSLFKIVLTRIAGAFLLFVTLSSPFKGASQDLLYNNNYSIACHNCYEKKYSKNITDALSYTSTIEIDIWDMPKLFKRSGALEKDWFVKHTFFEKGNKNCFGGSFASCLSAIERWSTANPNHNVITVFIDKKQGWSSSNGTRSPSDLDSLILSVFDKERIYTPSNFSGMSLNLRNAIKERKWASLTSLRNKIIFIITDATFFKSRNTVLNNYLNKVNNSAICFVAPTIKKQDEISRPKGISENNVSNIIFYNLTFKNSILCEKINKHNYVNRVFKAPENLEEVGYLNEKKINFAALYNYKLMGKLR